MSEIQKRGRGRPPIEGPKVVVRLTQPVADAVDRAAEQAGMPRATWLRKVIERAVGRP